MGMRFKNPRVEKLEESVNEAIRTKLSDEEAFKVVPFDEAAVERTGYSNYSEAFAHGDADDFSRSNGLAQRTCKGGLHHL